MVHGDRGISKNDLKIKPVKKKKSSLPDLPISPDLDKTSNISDNDIKIEIKKELNNKIDDEIAVYIPPSITVRLLLFLSFLKLDLSAILFVGLKVIGAIRTSEFNYLQ